MVGVEVVRLQLDDIAVRVFVIETNGWAVVDGPEGQHAAPLPVSIGQEQVGKRAVGVGKVVHATACFYFGTQVRMLDESQAVVFVVIGNKCKRVVFVNNTRAEKLDIKGLHARHVVRSEDDMGKSGRG